MEPRNQERGTTPHLPALFQRAFAEWPTSPALELSGQTLTFGDLDARAARMAAALRARGLAAGDRLAVYLENRIEFIDVFLACTRLGVILVPINILYREREVGHILADAEPRAVVASGPVPGGAAWWDVEELTDPGAEAPGLHRPEAEAPGLHRQDVEAPGLPGLTADTPAAIIYTSGTTGAAKGAVITHGNLVANARALVEAWRITRDDRLLLPLPLFHVHGLGNGVCCWLATGCRMRLLTRFDAAHAADEFRAFRPTVMFGVPTIYVRLLSEDTIPRSDAARIGAEMRLFVSGSAPLPAQVFEAFRAKFGHAILERYGMTETLMNISNPFDGERRPGTVGVPLPGVSVRIMTADAEAAPGERGEVQIQGANVCAGYWRRPDATRAAFQDGWFKTGDIGSRSADGYVTLHGRMSDLIISGGFNIYPREIEEVLLDEPGIHEAAVVGVPDAVKGEVPVAYVVADAAFDEAAVATRLRAALASFKMPRAFVRVDRLPRTALGKIQKHLLPPWTT